MRKYGGEVVICFRENVSMSFEILVFNFEFDVVFVIIYFCRDFFVIGIDVFYFIFRYNNFFCWIWEDFIFFLWSDSSSSYFIVYV